MATATGTEQLQSDHQTSEMSDEHNKARLERLLKASKSGDLTEIQGLLRPSEGWDHHKLIDEKDKYGNCSLHHASQFGQVDVVRQLIDFGADITQKNKHGYSPLHWAARYNQVDVLRVLLGCGADIDSMSEDGIAPLHEGIAKGNLDVVKILVEKGADICLLYKKNMSPLYLLAMKGNYECCRLLLEKAHNRKNMVNMLTRDGENALHAAIKCDVNYLAYHEDIRKQKKDIMKIIDLLLREDIDTERKNKHGDTPLQLAQKKVRISQQMKQPHYRAIEELLVKVRQEKLYSELMRQPCMADEDRRVKLYFCGPSGVGKTTLKESLQRKPLQAKLTCRDKERAPPPGEDHQKSPTAGIHVNSVDIPNAGKFSVWDCAGQGEYYPTHSRVLGSRNAVFLVLYKIADTDRGIPGQVLRPGVAVEQQKEKLLTWLRLIKSTCVDCQNTNDDKSRDKPMVIFVASRGDWVANHRDEALRVAQGMLTEAKEMFKDSLKILDDLFVMNCHKSQDDDMIRLRKCLKVTKEEILKTEKPFPKLCGAILKIKEEWAIDKSFPVLYWNQYEKRVRETVDERVDKDFLIVATSFLHDSGEFLYIKCRPSEDIVVLHPDWLCKRVFGPMFATDTFYQYSNRLKAASTHSLQELQTVLGDNGSFKLLLHLLTHFELIFPVVAGGNVSTEEFIIPGLLPTDMPADQWQSCRSMEHYYGRRFQCRGATDAFSPGFFPRLQIRLLKCFTRIGLPPSGVWRNGIKLCNDAEGLVYMTADNRAVHVCVRTRREEEIGACYDLLELVTWHVNDIAASACPGASIDLYILSSQSLRNHSDQEEVGYYSFQEICEAEDKKEKVFDKRIGRQESVTELLCPGFDRTFLVDKREKCDVMWLLRDCREKLVTLLEPLQPLSKDYRMMTEFMGYKVEYLYSLDARSPVVQRMKTSLLLDDWSNSWAQQKQRENRGEVAELMAADDLDPGEVKYYESSIGNLMAILRHMDRHDAVSVIEKMIQTLELEPSADTREFNSVCGPHENHI